MFSRRPLYFVGRLDKTSYRRSTSLEFEIQILDPAGECHEAAYFGARDEAITHFVRFTPDGPLLIEGEEIRIPTAVIAMARSRPRGRGEYVDEAGEIVSPF